MSLLSASGDQRPLSLALAEWLLLNFETIGRSKVSVIIFKLLIEILMSIISALIVIWRSTKVILCHIDTWRVRSVIRSLGCFLVLRSVPLHHLGGAGLKALVVVAEFHLQSAGLLPFIRFDRLFNISVTIDFGVDGLFFLPLQFLLGLGQNE